MIHNPDAIRTVAHGATTQPSLLRGNSFSVVAMLSWAGGFPAAEFLLQTWPPLALITIRFLVAVAILIPLWVLVDGPRSLLTARWGRGTWVGGLSFGLGTYLLLLAQTLTDPVTVTLIASSAPLVATLLEMINGTRRLTSNFALGLLASLLGGVVATSALAPAQLGPGAACAISSVFLFSWGSHAAVRDFPDLSPVGRSTITLAGGLMLLSIFLLGAYWVGLDVMPRDKIDGIQIGHMLIYAVAGMALSQVMWIASVGRLGVAAASFHINLAPFYVMLIMLTVGATWSWPQAIGAAIVGVGVILSQRKRPDC